MIKVKNLSKIYKLYINPKDRMKEALHPFRKQYHTNFYALKDVSFNIKKSETVGIIGKNGAGKSTLLKILTGVLTPTSGDYKANGKIASLLELGAGFNPELSGMENIYFNGSIIGYTREEMDRKLQSILDFADIGEFIHQPVKTYSSGMYVRLAFAIAINVDPEILIIDEALSVGDMRFQLKCFRKLEEIKSNGTTILFVTHDTGAVINHCDRAIWLHDGAIKELGKPDAVCKKYMSFMAYGAETEIKEKNKEISPLSGETKSGCVQVKTKNIPWKSVAGCESFGEGGAEITHVAFYEEKTMKSLEFLNGGERCTLSMKVLIKDKIKNPIPGFYLSDKYGNKVFGANSQVLEQHLQPFHEEDTKIIKFNFPFPLLGSGEYSFTVALAEGSQLKHIQHNWINEVCVISVYNETQLGKLGFLLIVNNVSLEI